MTNIMAVIEQIIMLFGITAVGCYMRRKSVMTDPVIKGVNAILLRVAWPCMILMTTQKERSDDVTASFLLILLITLIVLAAGCLITYSLSRKTAADRTRAIFTVLSVMPNAGFIGLPIIKAIYGDTGVFFLSAFLVGFNLVTWTLCVFLFTGVSIRSLKAALNPGFISAVAGTALFLLRVSLPTPLLSMVTQLGGLTTPLAMLLLGARLSQIPPKTLLDRKLWLGAGIKLLVMPLITLAVMRLMRVDETLTGITVLCMAMPSPAVAQLFAEKYDGDVPFAAAGISLTTLMCIVTIPLVLLATAV